MNASHVSTHLMGSWQETFVEISARTSGCRMPDRKTTLADAIETYPQFRDVLRQAGFRKLLVEIGGDSLSIVCMDAAAAPQDKQDN